MNKRTKTVDLLIFILICKQAGKPVCRALDAFKLHTFGIIFSEISFSNFFFRFQARFQCLTLLKHRADQKRFVFNEKKTQANIKNSLRTSFFSKYKLYIALEILTIGLTQSWYCSCTSQQRISKSTERKLHSK